VLINLGWFRGTRSEFDILAEEEEVNQDSCGKDTGRSTGKCHNDKVACSFVIGHLDMLILPLDHRKSYPR
jgi:hypothetical protein